jgi:ElaB/YqjD/DUF883 family membrane-anchored ribosome-binding protein
MIEAIPTKTSARDQLMNDLKSVITDAEAWLRHGGHLTGEEFQAAKARFEQTLSSAKADLMRLEQAVVEKTKEAAKATDDFVQENPWKAVGIGAAVGLVVGVLIARR